MQSPILQPNPPSPSSPNHSPSLSLITLDVPELGYTQFISSWLYSGPEGSFLVDPGPACTIPVLLDELHRRRIDHLDYILLTHIHMDHAGGLGHLMLEYPEATVVCHEKGVRHLVDPTRLWEGSKAVIGRVADVYGEMLPVPRDSITVTASLPFGSGIEVIPTPGHASHHQCFSFGRYLFIGELVGTYLHLEDELYLRPATPHRFVLEDYLSSMDIVEKNLRPVICFAHHGSSEDPYRILSTARDQLQLWVRIIDEHRTDKEPEEIVDLLLREDPVFARLSKLPPGIRNREKHFAGNSVTGIKRYLETR